MAPLHHATVSEGNGCELTLSSALPAGVRREKCDIGVEPTSNDQAQFSMTLLCRRIWSLILLNGPETSGLSILVQWLTEIRTYTTIRRVGMCFTQLSSDSSPIHWRVRNDLFGILCAQHQWWNGYASNQGTRKQNLNLCSASYSREIS
ncbi:hypothetical protein D918_03794 [Trichuris suis]|nr:hypothetical protein D918_03794 [Trichuris suis]